MRTALRLVFPCFVVALAASGCEDRPDTGATGGGPHEGGAGGGTHEGGAGGGTGGGGTGGGGGPVVQPAARLFVDERPHDAANEEVESAEARWGDPIRIVAEGLGAGRETRIDVSTGSWAVVAADDNGTVDLGRDAPLSGTWMAVDVDGPFWSAPPSDTPIFDVTVKVSDAQTGEVLAEKGIYRRPVNDGVDITDVSEGTRVGKLVRPPDDGTKRPAVLAFGGSEGGTWAGELMAYHLAQLGYVAFGVGYFAAPGLPAQLEQVPVEILKGDLDYLASQPDVDPDRIAVLGASRGGELALLLGATYPDVVHAVVAQVPSGYVWGATSGEDVSAWTLNGADLPAVPSSGAPLTYYQKGGEIYVLSTPSFLAHIEAATPEELAAARIPIENADGPVLLLAGEDDQLWPSCVLADVAWDALVSSRHTAAHADENHCFPGAGHFITFPPGSSTLDSVEYYNPQYDVWLVVGGSPEANARGERLGNNALRSFLEGAFGD